MNRDRLAALARREGRIWLDDLRLWAVLWCVGSLLAIVMATGLGLLLHSTMRKSAPYQDALRELRAHPAAMAALGTPIEDGWMRKGSIAANGGPRRIATLVIPVSGPRGRGTLYVQAVEGREAWRMRLLQLAPASGGRIDLMTDRR